MRRIADFLQECVNAGAFPGGTYQIGSREGILESGQVGLMGQGLGDVQPDTLYDMASVTKPLCALALMQQFEEGKLCLDDRVDHFLDDFKDHPKGAITLFELLTHTSVIPGQIQLYRNARSEEEMIEAIRYYAPRNTEAQPVMYSSQGLILIGKIIEKIDGERLDAVMARRIFIPLHMPDTMFNPSSSLINRVAPTEYCPWRGRMIRGEVHDENAVVMGGICAHAGLFSTAADISKIAAAMLGGHPSLLRPRTIELMTRNHTEGLNLARGLGWQKKDQTASPAGDLFTEASYGHTGFTGTSIWIDPVLDLYAVLLTNRVHPSRENEGIIRARHIFHNLAIMTYAKQEA